MQANLTTFAVVSMVALLAFFPIFNQVRDTSLEAIHDAKFKAKLKNVPDNLKDLPDDEKIDYYKGPPPEGDAGGLDKDRVDRDGKFETGDDRWEWKDPEDQAYAEENPEEEIEYRLEVRQEEIIYLDYNQSTQQDSGDKELTFDQQNYERLVVQCNIVTYTGSYDFVVRNDDGEEVTRFRTDNNLPVVDHSTTNCGDREFSMEQKISDVTVDYRPIPTNPNEEFWYRIVGIYYVKVRVDG